jgi:hypothetical protein
MKRKLKIDPLTTETTIACAAVLRPWLLEHAQGRHHAQLKKDIVAGTGYAWRTLCYAKRRLLKYEALPVGTCDDGWFIVTEKDELLEVNAREHSRAMSVLDSMADLRQAFFTYHGIRTQDDEIPKQSELGIRT